MCWKSYQEYRAIAGFELHASEGKPGATQNDGVLMKRLPRQTSPLSETHGNHEASQEQQSLPSSPPNTDPVLFMSLRLRIGFLFIHTPPKAVALVLEYVPPNDFSLLFIRNLKMPRTD